MKDFEQIWEVLVKEQPVLADPTAQVAIPVHELKAGTKLIYQSAYEAGRLAGVTEARELIKNSIASSADRGTKTSTQG